MYTYTWGLPWWLNAKEPACQCRRCGFDPWVGKILWSRKRPPTPVFLLEKSHGEGSLVRYSPWGPQNWTQWVTACMHTGFHGGQW